MSECSHNVPCPGFQDVTLTVTGVCDCHHFFWPGNPECPLHGDRITEAVKGWESAVETLRKFCRTERSEIGDTTDDWTYGWRTAIQSFNAAMTQVHQNMPTPGERK